MRRWTLIRPDFQSVEKAINLFYKGLDGKIEFIYDMRGDLNYRSASHFSPDEIEKIKTFIESTNIHRKSNISVIPTTVHTTEEGKRTGKNAVMEGKVHIIEIEPSKGEKSKLKAEGIIPFRKENIRSMEYVEKMLEQAFQKLPKNIISAVRMLYCTGGGINLVVEFAKKLNRKEILRLSEINKKIFKGVPYIDSSGSLIYHPQRLPGTFNWKYQCLVEFWNRDSFIDYPFSPLAVSFLEKYDKGQEKVNKDIKDAVRHFDGNNWEYFIENLLREVDIPYVFRLECEDRGYYYKCRCPFHPPDNNPSFIVYKNIDRGFQYAFDAHDGKGYTAITLAMALGEASSYYEAIKFLADALGLEMPRSVTHISSRKKEKEKIEEEDISLIEDWVRRAGLYPETAKVINLEGKTGEIVVKAKSVSGEKVDVTLTDPLFKSPESFLLLLKKVTGNTDIEYPYDNKKEQKEYLQLIHDFLIQCAVENRRVSYYYETKAMAYELIHKVIASTEVVTDTDTFLLRREGVLKSMEDGCYYISCNTLFRLFPRLFSGERFTLSKLTALLERVGFRKHFIADLLTFKVPLSVIKEFNIEEIIEREVEEHSITIPQRNTEEESAVSIDKDTYNSAPQDEDFGEFDEFEDIDF